SIDQQVKRMQLGVRRSGRVAVKMRTGNALLVQGRYSLAGSLTQLVDRTELDGLGRAGLGARRHQAVPLPVVAERALVGVTVERAAGDDPKGAGGDAVSAPVADVGLDIDVVELGVDEGAGRAR